MIPSFWKIKSGPENWPKMTKLPPNQGGLRPPSPPFFYTYAGARSGPTEKASCTTSGVIRCLICLTCLIWNKILPDSRASGRGREQRADPFAVTEIYVVFFFGNFSEHDLLWIWAHWSHFHVNSLKTKASLRSPIKKSVDIRVVDGAVNIVVTPLPHHWVLYFFQKIKTPHH